MKTKRVAIFLVPVLLFVCSVMLVACKAGGNSGSNVDGNPAITTAADINAYLANMSNNNEADGWSKSLETGRSSTSVSEQEAEQNGLSISGVPEGYQPEYQKVDLQMSMDDLTMWGVNNSIYPGNLVKINPTTANSDLGDITGLFRAPVTYSANLEGATGTACGLSSTTANSLSATREGIS